MSNLIKLLFIFSSLSVYGVVAQEQILYNQCRIFGGENTLQTGQMAVNEFKECFHNLFDLRIFSTTNNQKALDAEECRKVPLLLNCVGKFNKEIQPCLGQNEKNLFNIAEKIIKTLLLDLECKDKRLTVFVKSHGVECVQRLQDNIGQCVTSSFNKYTQNVAIDNPFKLSTITFNQDQCSDLDTAAECIEKTFLNNCEDRGAASEFKDVYKALRKVTPCNMKSNVCTKTSCTGADHYTGTAATAALVNPLIFGSLLIYTIYYLY